MGSLWTVVTILGPILLAAVLIWALMRNRRRRDPVDEARTERATHELNRDIDRESTD